MRIVSSINIRAATGRSRSQAYYRNLPVAALMFTLLTILFCTSILAEEEKPPLPDLKEIDVAGPYCDVYSLYA